MQPPFYQTPVADGIPYDNTISGLTATDVRAALDEIVTGGASKLIATFDTALTTTPGQLLVVSGASFVSPIADNDSLTMPNGIFGICFSKPTTTRANVIFCGVIGGYLGFTVGSPLFVSTLGTLTHTPPATGMLQQLGFTISTTEFFLQMMQPIRKS